jgi:hypothetical protein
MIVGPDRSGHPARPAKKVPYSAPVRLHDIKAIDLTPAVQQESISTFNALSEEAITCMKKKHVLCYIIFMGHTRAGEHKESAYYEKLFGLTARTVARINASMALAANKFPRLVGNVSQHQAVNTQTADDILRKFCRKFTPLAGSCYPKVEKLLSDLRALDPWIDDVFPQKVAASVILLYMETNGMIINDVEFVRIVGVRDYQSTLRHLHRLMSGI